MKKSTAGNSFLLFLTACIWGMAFVSQSKGMEYMHPFTFNGVRSLIGAMTLFIYLLIRGKFQDKNVLSVNWKKNVKAGLLCGLALTTASTLQQFGIQYTTVGKAGFITTLYIIFVPLAGIFLKKKVPGIVWVAAGMAAVGMYLLCMTESLVLGSGDILVFLCAIVFAVHIIVIDHYAEETDGVIVSCIQFLVCGVVCGIGALIWGGAYLAPIRQRYRSFVICRCAKLWRGIYPSDCGTERCESYRSSIDLKLGICRSYGVWLGCL